MNTSCWTLANTLQEQHVTSASDCKQPVYITASLLFPVYRLHAHTCLQNACTFTTVLQPTCSQFDSRLPFIIIRLRDAMIFLSEDKLSASCGLHRCYWRADVAQWWRWPQRAQSVFTCHISLAEPAGGFYWEGEERHQLCCWTRVTSLIDIKVRENRCTQQDMDAFRWCHS